MAISSTAISHRGPSWVWLVVILLVAMEPVLHVWIACAPPDGMMPSGLHTLGTYVGLVSMKYCADGFYSPYASPDNPHGNRHHSFYPLPYHWMYGLLGVVARALGLSEFTFLGFAHGAGMALFLYAVHRLFRTVAPRVSGRAFVLFAAGGGLGGVLYLITGALGLHDHPLFPEYFQRYALYELVQGSRAAPHLLMAELYYTVPLGCCLLGLTGLARALQERRLERRYPRRPHRAMLPGMFLLGVGTLINLRVGLMVFAVGVLMVLSAPAGTTTWRMRLALVFSAPVCLAAGACLLALRANPYYVANMLLINRQAMWFSPFLSAAFFFCLLAPIPILRSLEHAPRWLRVAGFAAAGYILAFAVLYVGYQVYYGNFWRCLDYSPAVRLCDWALLGAIPGAALAWVGRPRRAPALPESAADDAPPWIAMWFLGSFALAFSAFGQGWLLRFSPDRIMVMLGPPMAVLAAYGLEGLGRSRPRLAAGLQGTIVACGITSILVAWLVFQGPLGVHSAQRQFPWTRYAFITTADGAMLNRLEPGRLLAPADTYPTFGDVAVLRKGVTTVFGEGTLDFSHQVVHQLMPKVKRFFSTRATEEERLRLLRDWAVDYVLCPDTTPVDPAALSQLRALPCLESFAEAGRGVLFRVDKGLCSRTE